MRHQYLRSLSSLSAFVTVACLHAQPGTLDPTFDDNGLLTINYQSSLLGPNLTRVASNGNIFVTGNMNDDSGSRFFVTVLDNTGQGVADATGEYDAAGTVSTVQDAALQTNDKLVIVGECNAANTMGVARYNMDGSLDNTFSGDGLLTIEADGQFCRANSVNILPDGRILVGGGAYTFGNEPACMLVMLTSTGALDNTFGTGGKMVFSTEEYAEVWRTAVQADGDIVAVGGYLGDSNSSVMLARLQANGDLDNGFSGDGYLSYATDYTYARGVEVAADGTITALLNGNSSVSVRALVRYTPAGVLDATFGGGDGSIDLSPYFGTLGNAMALTHDPQGHLIIAGDDGDLNHGVVVLRMMNDGTLDNAFATGGVYGFHTDQTPTAAQDAVVSNGRIMLAGRQGPDITGPVLMGRLINDVSAGVADATDAPAIGNAWPNPSSDGRFIVDAGGTHLDRAEVIDAMGRCAAILPLNGAQGVLSLDLSALKNGAYTARLIDREGTVRPLQLLLAR